MPLAIVFGIQYLQNMSEMTLFDQAVGYFFNFSVIILVLAGLWGCRCVLDYLVGDREVDNA
jgi:hypothetical protein